MGSRRMFRRITSLWCVVLVVACTLLTGPPVSARPEQGPARPTAEPAPTAVVAPAAEPAPPAAGSAAAVTYWLHHFNFCSLVCQEKIAGRNQPLNMINWWNAVDTPWFISLNEICQSEIKKIADQTGLGSAWILTKRYDSDCPGLPEDQRFGNAILYRHAGSGRRNGDVVPDAGPGRGRP